MERIEKGGLFEEKLLEGLHQRTIKINEPLEYHLSCKQNTDLFIQVEKATQIKLIVEISKDAQCSIFLWNESSEDIFLDEAYQVLEGGSLRLAYGDCDGNKSIRHVQVNLEKKGAEAVVKSTVLAQGKKEFKVVCTSKAPNTECRMENYGVVTGAGSYHLDAIGAIEKGSYQSQSHQTSRALMVNGAPEAIIIPQLLIDENDVNASHATSIGQVDENQMMYLQSRGLTQKQVLELITVGYLMPIAEFIDHEELKEMLAKKIESKVKLACWT
ncbi:MAG: SufD family Fe-S cluster assembly protein [Anaerorhabdus sp.]